MKPIDLSGFVEWTAELAEEYQDKCDAIITWASDRSDFDDSFVVDMGEKIADGEELTEAQAKAIDNIIDKFNIDF